MAGALFDEWGRPQTDIWSQRVLDWPDFEQRVRPCPDPGAQAERIVALARDYAEPEGLLAVGVADAEVLAPLENGLGRARITAFNPEGRPRRRDGLYALLVQLANLRAPIRFSLGRGLLRCPDVLDGWAQGAGPEFSPPGCWPSSTNCTRCTCPRRWRRRARHAEISGRWPGALGRAGRTCAPR